MTTASRKYATPLAASGITLLVGLWMLGQALSDAFAWSQWLLWIPTPLVLLTLLGVAIGGVATCPPDESVRQHPLQLITIILTLGVAGYFVLVEHRFMHRPSHHPNAMRLVHWNLASRSNVQDRHASAILQQDPDLCLLTNAGALLSEPAFVQWASQSHQVFPMGPFTIASRYPIIEARWLVSSSEIDVGLVVIGGGHRSLSIWMIDFPSHPTRGRLELVRKTRRLLESVDASPPDIILGDLNITRGSTALRELAPEHRHAFSQAGSGYGATFPRVLPLLHIDHILTGPAIDVRNYSIIDPGVGRHRLQHMEFFLTSGD